MKRAEDVAKAIVLIAGLPAKSAIPEMVRLFQNMARAGRQAADDAAAGGAEKED